MLELVDVFVWVTDPQKYADARLHDEFVSLLSQHDAVTLSVLNQSDRLTTEAVKTTPATLPSCSSPTAWPMRGCSRRRPLPARASRSSRSVWPMPLRDMQLRVND